jgi:hypothetical protein
MDRDDVAALRNGIISIILFIALVAGVVFAGAWLVHLLIDLAVAGWEMR